MQDDGWVIHRRILLLLGSIARKVWETLISEEKVNQMRRCIAFCLALLLASGNSAFGQQVAGGAVPQAAGDQKPAGATQPDAKPARPPVPNTLLDGTAIKLRLAENLTSATAKAGDQVPFEVTEDVEVDGVLVVAKGAQAQATVTDASPKKSMGRGGKLDVNVNSVRLLDGEKAQLRASQDNRGGGHVGAMTGAMVATAIVFFPAAPLFLFVHGKDVVIPQGTEITAFVQGDMKLDMAKFVPAAPAGIVAASAAAAASGLTIDASVPNCDIEVDGSFVGNTPSTLNLAAGKHDIVVKKVGYKDWTRSMNVSGGAVHVSAEMVAAQ